MSVDAVLIEVAEERRRQDARFGREHDAALTAEDWLARLGKQVGHVCRLLVYVPPLNPAEVRALRAELVQVAAVCAAWYEASRRPDDEGWTGLLEFYVHHLRGGHGLTALLRRQGSLASTVAADARWRIPDEQAWVAAVAVTWAASLEQGGAMS